ncbi:MAG: polymerase III, delta prime subunit, DNA polymerase III subunit delta' protein [Candidatus Peregrinibacteria bacterium GW2011_GWE2_39_6]|nr:MAG: polymerase III, delta prime subunit, DNA polymerase III subunit delta' protein [Candidatus Peregrinibacteria bacterium GW2011_GWF2_39_17]KKR26384.1 MAG: polymerase III, delta prime subunit, DNA polymerase III subunit delta' protein [Candidatus Peregrinibacteria bacterium GW2011_GWE2_39_6]HCW32532.1 hypothetical protein [Candidatus Peregrinibacteria bacterium]
MLYKWPIVGHTKPITQLENDLRQNHLSHAYLFSGPSQIGKLLIARTLSQILQCPNNFCRVCPSCKQIEKGQHINTFEFLDNGESLKIEEVRELLSHLSTTSNSDYKIVIMQNIERLTLEAANALLKNIEEPISQVLFLLTTTCKQKLLPTLVSRTRNVSFASLSESLIKDYLLQIRPDLDSKTLEMITVFSMGKPGRAKILLQDTDYLRFFQDFYDQIIKLFEHSNTTDRFMFVENFYKNQNEIKIFLELFLYMTRGLLYKKMEGKIVTYTYSELFQMIDALAKTRFDLERNINTRLSLENLLLFMPQREEILS